jgi:hypothetical protein
MASVFISYSSKSKDLVSGLADDLEMAGNQIWFDHKLTGGQAWWDQILEQIRQCDLFVFALTPQALDSHPCKLEYTYAHSLNKAILPVLLTDGVSVNLLPSELTTIQFVDYRGDNKQAAFKLMNALNNLPAPQPLPDPMPAPPPVPISYIGNLKDEIDSDKALSFEEQASLLLRLKEHLHKEDEAEDIVQLFDQMRRRTDLYARVGEEIDEVLAKHRHSSTQPAVRIARAPAESASVEMPAAYSAPNPAQTMPAAQRVNVYKPAAPAQTGEDQPWGTGIMLLLGIGTFIIPLVGIVAGIFGMRSPSKRNQGIGLLAFGIIMGFLWLMGTSFLSELAYYGW